jgi:hypothetical protein
MQPLIPLQIWFFRLQIDLQRIGFVLLQNVAGLVAVG